MKDSAIHIFSNGFAALNNDLKHTINRIGVAAFLLIWITPLFVQAQHIDNRKRLDSFQRARTASAVLRTLATVYTVTGGGSYCSGGAGLAVGLDGSETDTTYQLQLNGTNIGAPVTGTGGVISFGLQTAAGIYTVLANTVNGPVAMNGSATVIVNALPTPTAGSNTPQCAGSTLNLTATAGSTYSWTGPNGFTSSSPTPSITNVTTAASGTYTVIVTNGNGCSATTSTNVTINALPTPTAGSNTPQCAGSTLNLTATGGGTYSWTGPNGFTSSSPTPSITNVTTAASGIYTVIVTDGNGCSATTTTTVTINALPTPTAGSNTPQCAGGTLNLTASGGNTYSWTGPNGFTSNAQNPSITNVTTAASGTYTVIVTNGNGCSATTSTNVTINALPTPTAGSNTPQCAGGTLNLTATGGSTYSWTGPNGFTSSSPTPSITNVTTAASGIYTVIVTDGNGCSATTTTSVTINALPTPTAGSNTPQCAGATLNLTASGGSTYSWTGPNGFTSNTQNPSITNVTTAASGTYTVIVTNGNGCSATTSTNVTINALPTPTAGSNTPQCAGGTLNLTATGGSTYSWTGPNGFTSSSPTPSITNVTTAASGIYTVIVTDGNGCSATTSTNVTINALPTPTAGSNTPQCAGGTVNLTATGGSTYSWTGPNGFTSNTQNPSITNVTTAASGTYTVIVTNGNGCSATTTTIVTINALPTPTAGSNTPQCAGATLNLTASGGSTYSWTGPNGFTSNTQNPSITNVTTAASGIYTVIVTNGNGCSATTTTSVTINALPTPTAGSNTPQCAGGTLNLTATGGSTYSWTGPNGFTSSSPTPSITNVTTAASGTYTVIVTNGNGCSATTTTTVTINALPVATAGSNTPQCAGGTLNLTANGGSTYSWTGPNGFTSNAQNPSITNVTTAASGTYSVIVTNGNGCSATTTTTVTINALPVVTASSNTPQCAGGTLNLTANGGSTYSWTGPNGFTSNAQNPSITNVTTAASGTYTVIVTNGNGCSATTTTTVTINALPTPTAGSNTPQCAGSTLNLTANGGSTYSWTGPNGFTSNAQNPSITNVTTAASGTYTVIVTNGNGCSATTTTTVTINALPVATASSNTPLCVGSNLNLTATGGGTYNWTGPNGFTSTVQNPTITNVTTAEAGVYSVTATVIGCTGAPASTTVVINPQATVTPGGPNTVCQSATPVAIPLTGASVGGGATTGAWSITSGGGTLSSTTQTGSPATVTYTPAANFTGIVTLTLTTNDPAGPCSAVSATRTINVTQGATANAGAAQTVCAGGIVSLAGTMGGSATSVTWTAPSGTFSDPASLTSTYTPTITNGTVTLTLTTNDPDGAGSCTAAISTVVITVNTAATVTPGGPNTVCQSATPVAIPLTGASVGGGATTGAWSITSGGGTLSSTTQTGSPATVTYTPAANFTGTVTLTLTTNDPAGPCPAVNATRTINVTQAATANAGAAQTVCAGGSITLAGTIGGSAATITWTAPSGTFSDLTSLTSTYTPSIISGTVTLTLTTNDPDGAGPCTAAISTVVITVNAVATLNAGGPNTVCQSATPAAIPLTGASVGGGASTGAWSITSGGGTLSSTTQTGSPATVTYTPAANFTGTITLTLTTNDPAGPCPAVSATRTINVTQAANVNAGTAQTVCAGSTVSLAGTIGGSATSVTWTAPSGTFSNPSSLTSTYTPSITSGTVTLTLTTNDPDGAGPCTAATSTVMITVNTAPTVTPGGPNTICQSITPAAITLSGASVGGSASTGAWSITSGGGTLSSTSLTNNPDNVTYTPAANFTGTVTLTLTTNDPTGPCPAVSATRTINVTQAANANAGTAQTVCTGSTVSLAGSMGGSAISATWTAPSGTFSNPTSLTSTYTPSITSGTVTLTLTTNDPDGAGPCTAATSTVVITVNAVATVNAGGPNTVCQSATPVAITLSGASVGGGASTGAWSITSGGGTLSSTTQTGSPATVTYMPAANFTGTITLTLTTNDPAGPCPAVSATRTINVTQAANANAGTAQTVCAGSTVSLAGTMGGSATSVTWTAPSGTFSNPSSLTSTYTPSITSGTVTLTLTTNDPDGAGPCTVATSLVIITINPLPAAPTSPVNGSRCGPGTVNLSATSAAGTTIDWYDASTGGTLLGTGTPFTTPSISATTTYYAQARNTSTGCVSVTRTAVTATFNALPVITVTPPSSTFCSGNSVTLTASGANTYTWSPATDLSIATGSIVIAYPAVTTTYTVTGTGANGCTGTANVTITVIQGPSGDVSSSPAVCPGANSGTLTLSNYTGNILRWESSTDGGATWTTISNTTTSQPYLNLTTTTIYRAALELNGCNDYSSIGIVPVNPPFTPTATATPTIFCLGQSAILHASDYGPPPFPVEDFQNANPAGWTGNDANSNNKDDNSEWGETNSGKIFNGILFNSNAPPTNTKFMIVNGDGGGSVVSLGTPPFSLVGVTNPTFNFYTALNFNATTTGWVEISTDGGLSYTTIKTYTGPTNVGNPNNGFIQESINLSAYIGQTNVRVRFRYSGTAGSNWAIDNVGIAGTYQPVAYQWSPTTYLTPATGIGQNVTTTPTVAGTFNYCVVATTAAGCSSSPICVDATAKPIPTCSITGASTVCPGATTTYSAPAIAGYTYNWTISGGATISGSTTGQTVTVVANNTCGTYTLTLVTTLNGCSSAPCTLVVNVVDNTAPVASAPATQSFQCLTLVPAPGTLTATDNCSGNITATGVDAQVANGCGYTITRTWTFTDACNNTSSVSQIINVLDNTAPVAPAAPASQNFQCLALVPAPGTLTATDNCSGNITATGVDVQVAKACGYTITRTWTFTDACNNTSSVSQIINVVDDIPPVITCPPAQIFCAVNSNTYTIPPATASDNCSGTLNITYQITGATTRSGTGNNASGVFNIGVSTITWTVTDTCGNTATCTTTVTINPRPSPIIYHN
jgi:hypothetical protein